MEEIIANFVKIDYVILFCAVNYLLVQYLISEIKRRKQ